MANEQRHDRHHRQFDPAEVQNPDVRHETRTMNVRLVLFCLLLLVVGSVMVHFSIKGLMAVLEAGRQPLDNPPNPIASKMPPRRPPDPQLQPDPVGDLHMLRQQEDDILHGYAWVDEKAGKVRIPIARAMQLLAERGLPAGAVGAPPPKPQPVQSDTAGRGAR
jgi:hypothetical protein